jgi:hypothetical protein
VVRMEIAQLVITQTPHGGAHCGGGFFLFLVSAVTLLHEYTNEDR